MHGGTANSTAWLDSAECEITAITYAHRETNHDSKTQPSEVQQSLPEVHATPLRNLHCAVQRLGLRAGSQSSPGPTKPSPQVFPVDRGMFFKQSPGVPALD